MTEERQRQQQVIRAADRRDPLNDIDVFVGGDPDVTAPEYIRNRRGNHRKWSMRYRWGSAS